MEPNDTADLAPDTTPQWDLLPEAIPCPRCGYNLRMLTHPRCPECGLEFAWTEVIESAQLAAACPHFEYQWRVRPVRSFLWTAWQLLRPWRYWRELPLSAPPRFTGLVVFCLTLMVVVQILSAGVELAAGLANIQTIPAAYRARRTTAAWAWIIVRDWYNQRVSGEALLRSAVVFLVFAGITWLCLGMFWQTRRRYNLVPRLRAKLIMLSCALLVFYWYLLWEGLCVVRSACCLIGWRPPWLFLLGADLATLVGLCVFYVSLGCGLSRHARVERAWGMVGLILVLQLTLLLFIVVVSTVQFDSWDNPIAQSVQPLFPRLIPSPWTYW